MSKESSGKNHRNAGKLSYLVYYTGSYVSGEIQISDEHNSYIWVDKDNYQRLINDSLGNTTKALEVYFFLKES